VAVHAGGTIHHGQAMRIGRGSVTSSAAQNRPEPAAKQKMRLWLRLPASLAKHRGAAARRVARRVWQTLPKLTSWRRWRARRRHDDDELSRFLMVSNGNVRGWWIAWWPRVRGSPRARSGSARTFVRLSPKARSSSRP